MSGTLGSDFRFGDDESARLTAVLLEVASNPYREYAQFRKEIQEVADDGQAPARFTEFCAAVAHRDMAGRPVIVIENCPLDPELPVFGAEDPVADKYRMKRTFVAEGFLALHSELTGVDLIGHATVNNGDFFHDVYPKQVLSQRRFTTPVDHILTAGGDDTTEDHHAVMAENGTPHVLERRTRGLDEEAHRALDAFLAALHRNQVTRESRPGDLLTFSNDHVVHGRFVQELSNPASMRTRWLIKTHNVNRLDDYLDLFVPGRPGVVA